MKNAAYKVVYVITLLLFASCINNKQDAPTLPLKAILDPPFVTGGERNGRHSMEGIEFSINKIDTHKFDYRFSITNWHDKFEDLTGTVALDSSTLFNDTFFMKNVRDSMVTAYKLYDNTKKYPIWIGMPKNDPSMVRLYEYRDSILKEIKGPMWAK